jgi:hypothetical protein
VGAAGWIADDNADRFTLKVGSLRRSVIAPEQCEDKQQASLFHIASSARGMNATINPFKMSQSETIGHNETKRQVEMTQGRHRFGLASDREGYRTEER